MAANPDPDSTQVNEYMSKLTAIAHTLSFKGSKGYIYNHVGGRAEVDHTVDSFVNAVLNLLGLDENDDDWSFMVDQYDNSKIHQGKPRKMWWNHGRSRSTMITKHDQTAWGTIILPLVMDHNQDWMMAVSPYRTDTGMAPPYLKPAYRNGVGNLAELESLKITNPESDVNRSCRHDTIGKVFRVRPESAAIYLDPKNPNAGQQKAYLLHQKNGILGSRIKTGLGGRDGSSNLHQSETMNQSNGVTELPSTGRTAVNFKPSSSKLFPKGTIYGYNGKVFVNNNANSIRDGALQLLDLLPSEEWEFTIDIRARDRQFMHHITIVKSNFHTAFRDHILPLTRERTWSIFVRTINVQPSQWEPLNNTQHIIHLVNERGVSYWKIPSGHQLLSKNFGINQPQKDFRRAMRVFFPRSRQLPRGSISLSTATKSVDIGFGEVELTRNLWAMVKQDIRDAASTSSHLTYSVRLRTLNDMFQPATVGVKLTGSHHYGLCERGNFKSMMGDFITTISNCDLANRQHPADFRIWKTADLRESNEDYAVLEYGVEAKQINALSRWFESGSTETNCIHFRPEWATIVLIDVMNRHRSVAWDVESEHSLAGFKKALKLLFRTKSTVLEQKKRLAKERYMLLEPQSDQTFVVTENTTEDEWRKYVYDWFHSSRIYVQYGGGDEYELETETLWGISKVDLPRGVASGVITLPYNGYSIMSNAGSTQTANEAVIPIKGNPAAPIPISLDSSNINGNQDLYEDLPGALRGVEADNFLPGSPNFTNYTTSLNPQFTMEIFHDLLHAKFLELTTFCPRCSLHLASCTQTEIAQHNVDCPVIPTNPVTGRAEFSSVTTTTHPKGTFRGTANQYTPFRQSQRVDKTTRAGQPRRGAMSDGVFVRLGSTTSTSGPARPSASSSTQAGPSEPTPPRHPTQTPAAGQPQIQENAGPSEPREQSESVEEPNKLWDDLFKKIDRALAGQD